MLRLHHLEMVQMLMQHPMIALAVMMLGGWSGVFEVVICAMLLPPYHTF